MGETSGKVLHGPLSHLPSPLMLVAGGQMLASVGTNCHSLQAPRWSPLTSKARFDLTFHLSRIEFLPITLREAFLFSVGFLQACKPI